MLYKTSLFLTKSIKISSSSGVHKIFELISMLKTATAIVKNIRRTVATRYDDRNERARAAISGSAPIHRSLGNHTNLFTLWQRFSDVIHRIVMDAEQRNRFPRKP
ncbi:hypothetical protein TNCT_131691 [Trichonephila clavata]|uniref:Uncharacterized protein n=1 Tax=Trichonephila clavata TaxID=2740835 RepID=A0A8X6EZ39_TRICU|nr:hypothetical protein TNCT_131691 [Trichonephila clavata]